MGGEINQSVSAIGRVLVFRGYGIKLVNPVAVQYVMGILQDKNCLYLDEIEIY
jgi:hypothetical protein